MSYSPCQAELRPSLWDMKHLTTPWDIVDQQGPFANEMAADWSDGEKEAAGDGAVK